MSLVLTSLFAVMLLPGPDETIDAEGAAAVSEDADRVELKRPAFPGRRSSKRIEITGDASDFDRQAGVIRFEGSVKVSSSGEIDLYADEAYAFLSASNEMTRVVLVGNVSITNETRSGACAWATYRRRKREIEMFGNGRDIRATLADGGENAGTLAGRRIRFWLDTEQVEVEAADIRMKEDGEIGKEAASGRTRATKAKGR